MIGRFNALGQWHPMVKRSETKGAGKGAVRRLKLIGGGTQVERLEHVSEAEHVYLYTVVASPLPVIHCVAEIRVSDRGDGTSIVEWSSNFVPAGALEGEAAKALRDVYAAGLDNLKRIYDSLTPSGG
jgi:Polyketide cyclase / dehydrase and lipid transport